MPRKPLKIVMIRRGQSEVSNVASENLITFIRKKLLLGTDEISGDGKDWIRVDRHYQLRKYFQINSTRKNQKIAVRNDMETSVPPLGLTSKLEKLADLLNDINQ
tara:strand:- start:307 stop:618 length:312 start_codon:yes stop_codon:yes gene_type:complete